MKIAVVGASGFVGSHVIKHFVAKGHEVVVYGRAKRAPAQLPPFVSYRAWDITVPFSDPSNADVVIHAAGYVDFWGDPAAVRKINVLGTQHVLDFSQNARQFIYISTANVYGSFEKHEVVEDDAYQGRYGNIYAATKREAEEVIRAQAVHSSVVILRPHAIYGPGDRTLLPQILRRVRRGIFLLPGGGESQISITHVGNLCQALSLVVEKHPAGVRVLNVADTHPVALKMVLDRLLEVTLPGTRVVPIPIAVASAIGLVAETIAQCTGGTPVITRDTVHQVSHTSTVSLAAIAELGYKPKYDLDGGLHDLREWLESLGGASRYLQDPKSHVWYGRQYTY